MTIQEYIGQTYDSVSVYPMSHSNKLVYQSFMEFLADVDEYKDRLIEVHGKLDKRPVDVFEALDKNKGIEVFSMVAYGTTDSKYGIRALVSNEIKEALELIKSPEGILEILTK